MEHPTLHQKTLLLLLVLVTLAFAGILLPFFYAVFWSAVLAVVFMPLYRRLRRRLGQRPNLAAGTTLLLCLVIVILPLMLIGSLLLKEAAHVFEQLQSGRIDLGAYLQKGLDLLPQWLVNFLERQGLTRISSLQEKLSGAAMQGSRFFVNKAVSFGQDTFSFLTGFVVMLYVLFFLLRDGEQLIARVRQALPMSLVHKQRLFANLGAVIRATIKGNFVVAAIQGTLGGMIFALLGIGGAALWGAVMAFLSLLPAFGAALVWAPVALYFLLTGALWKGLVLIGFGMLVIGLIDNLLRPLLVGRDTRIPDYVVLLSTLGGLALFGLSGFVLGPVIAGLFIVTWGLFSPAPEAPPRS